MDEAQAGASESASNSSALDALTQKILTLLQSKPKGINNNDIDAELPDLQPQQKAQILNRLLNQGAVDVLQGKNSLIYRYKDPNKAKIPGTDNDERVVYAIIEEGGNKGIWIRDIRHKSNLNPTQLNKILKSLETKKLIKAVKSVAASKKKVYMLYNLEPDRSVTGGAWYQDQDFEAEFVDILNQQCYRFLEKRAEETKASKGPVSARNVTYASSQEVWKYISDLGISKVKLSVEDLEMILNTLIYDGKVEKVASTEGNLYRAIPSFLDSPGLMSSPCGVCPVRNNCNDTGDITPIKCQYISDWLN